MRHVEILIKGVEAWNGWRAENPQVFPRLAEAHLRGSLGLAGADLRRADLTRAHLNGVDLTGADLRGALLCGASLANTTLRGALLDEAQAFGADFRLANLVEVRAQDADLVAARFGGAEMTHFRAEGARMRWADLEGARVPGARLPHALRTDPEGVVGEAEALRFAWRRLWTLLRGLEDRRLTEAGLTPKTLEALAGLRVRSVGDLLQTTPTEMLRHSPLGASGLLEIEGALTARARRFAGA